MTIKVGEKTFDAITEGNQVFFRGNRIVKTILNRARNGKQYDRNDIVEDYDNGMYTLEDMVEFYALIGYSLSGFKELSMFSFLPVETVEVREATAEEVIFMDKLKRNKNET